MANITFKLEPDRIVVFHLLGILVTGMLVPSNDERLLKDTGTAAQSPYVIAIQIAGIKVQTQLLNAIFVVDRPKLQGLPHVISAGGFTSAFSAGNSYLYSG